MSLVRWMVSWATLNHSVQHDDSNPFFSVQVVHKRFQVYLLQSQKLQLFDELWAEFANAWVFLVIFRCGCDWDTTSKNKAIIRVNLEDFSKNYGLKEKKCSQSHLQWAMDSRKNPLLRSEETTRKMVECLKLVRQVELIGFQEGWLKFCILWLFDYINFRNWIFIFIIKIRSTSVVDLVLTLLVNSFFIEKISYLDAVLKLLFQQLYADFASSSTTDLVLHFNVHRFFISFFESLQC